MTFFSARVWEFLIFGAKYLDSRHFQLAIYTVFYEESESAVRIYQFLHPEEKNQKNQPTRVSISDRKISYHTSTPYNARSGWPCLAPASHRSRIASLPHRIAPALSLAHHFDPKWCAPNFNGANGAMVRCLPHPRPPNAPRAPFASLWSCCTILGRTFCS